MVVEQNLEYLSGDQLRRLFLVYLSLAPAEFSFELLSGRGSAGRSNRRENVSRNPALYWASAGRATSKAFAPFQRICTPMQTNKNDERRMMTPIAVAPSARARRSEKP